MIRAWRLPLLTIGLMWLICSAAGAKTSAPLSNPWFAKADAIAAAYYGTEPECPAESRKWYPEVFHLGVVAESEPRGCIRWINRLVLASMTWPQFCNASGHEFGHLIGYGHTGDEGLLPGPTDAQDPLHIMNPTIETMGRIPACGSLRPDGHTRSPRNPQDRRWCVSHRILCASRYPNLDKAS